MHCKGLSEDAQGQKETYPKVFTPRCPVGLLDRTGVKSDFAFI